MNNRKVILSGILIAIVVVLGFFMIPIGKSNLRLSTSVIVLSSFIVGPLYGGLIGFVSDLLQSLFKGYGINLYTVSNVLYGVLPFYFYKALNKSRNFNVVLLFCCCYVSLLVGSFINSFQDVLFASGSYGMYLKLLVLKWPSYLIILPLHCFIVCVLFKPLELIKKQFKF